MYGKASNNQLVNNYGNDINHGKKTCLKRGVSSVRNEMSYEQNSFEGNSLNIITSIINFIFVEGKTYRRYQCFRFIDSLTKILWGKKEFSVKRRCSVVAY